MLFNMLFMMMSLFIVCIAFSLGAQHDGTGNNCSSSDQFIMAVGPQYLTDDIFKHPFNFSFCSIDYFRAFLRTSAA
jgi:hypothetical protein